jgi:hypothetical protein
MHFDLIIFDEASQQSQKMLRQVRVALSESSLEPFVIFVGDAYDVLPLWWDRRSAEAALAEATAATPAQHATWRMISQNQLWQKSDTYIHT